MVLPPINRLLLNLKQEIPPYMRREYLPREVAYERLKRLSGRDFGYDYEKWEQWVREQVALGVKFQFDNLP